jgi:hypothetical protein
MFIIILNIYVYVCTAPALYSCVARPLVSTRYCVPVSKDIKCVWLYYHGIYVKTLANTMIKYIHVVKLDQVQLKIIN